MEADLKVELKRNKDDVKQLVKLIKQIEQQERRYSNRKKKYDCEDQLTLF